MDPSWESYGKLEASVMGKSSSSRIYPLVICYIAMENGAFIDGLPIKNGDFPWLC